MDLMIILSVVFVCFSVEASNSQQQLTIAVNNSDATHNAKPISTDSGSFPLPEDENENEKGDKKEEKEEEENEIENFEIQTQNSNYHSSNVPTMPKDTSEKLLLSLLSQIRRKARGSLYENYPPTTEVSFSENNWQNYNFDDIENSGYQFDDSGWKRSTGDYDKILDYYTNYFTDVLRHHDRYKKPNEKYDRPKTDKYDYFEDREQSNQKNGFLDYYQTTQNKLGGRYRKEDYLESLPKNQRQLKEVPKTSCKHYLQFLKYAFKQLDSLPYHAHDYGETYDDYGSERYTTNVIGPTVYVDTCGTGGHSNFQKITFEGELPSTIPFLYSGMSKYHTSTPNNFFQDTEKSKNEDTTSFTYTNPYFEDKMKPTTETVTETTTVNYAQVKASRPVNRDFFYNNFYLNYPEFQNKTEDSNYNEKFRQKNTKSFTLPKDDLYSTVTEVNFFQEQTTLKLNTINQQMTGFQPFGFEQGLTKAQKDFKKSHQTTLLANTLPPRKSIWITPSPKLEQITFQSSKDDQDCTDRMLPCPDILNITYPLNGYCNKYVSCEMGRAIRRTCPEGLHFNVVTKSCDLPHNSFCNYLCPQENGYFGVPGDCGGYFVCRNSVAEYRMCPPGMHWDVYRESCTFIESSSCPMKCSAPHEAKPYEGVCNAYVICINGIPYYHKCPPNTNFDKSVLTCVPEKSFQCENNPRLLTSNSNVNELCRNVQVKYGSKEWCRYVNDNEEN